MELDVEAWIHVNYVLISISLMDSPLCVKWHDDGEMYLKKDFVSIKDC